jgi:hypothetical protein
MLPGKPLVEPEGGGGATHDGGACDGVVERETFPHNNVEEGGGEALSPRSCPE